MDNSRYRKTKSNVTSLHNPLPKEPKSKKEPKSGWFQRFKDKMTGKNGNSKESVKTAKKAKSSTRRRSKEQLSREKTKEQKTMKTKDTQEEVSKQPATAKQGSGEKVVENGSKEAIATVSKENISKEVVSKEAVGKTPSKENIAMSKEKAPKEKTVEKEKEKEKKANSKEKSKEREKSKEKEKEKAQPRKRPSFQHDKKIKTTKDIQEEMAKQSKIGSDLNTLVGTNERKYEKKDLVAKGKKGMIYKVQDTKTGCEQNKLVVKMSDGREAINNEIRFLLEFQQTLRDQTFGADHILSICSYGAVAEYGWFVQPMCGPNLDQLRQQMDAEFSPHTALRLGLMALDAISCLHLCDVVHGRIEPQHFVIGCDTLKSNIYLVGLGHIVQANAPPPLVWNKNPFYAPSRNYKDPFNTEMETWVYLLLDLYGRPYLPWNKRRWGETEIQRWKEALFMFPVLLPPYFPPLFHDLFTIIAKCDENETTATRAIRRRMVEYLKQEKISRQLPFEWEASELEKEAMLAASKDTNSTRLYLQRGKALRDKGRELLKDFHSDEGEA